MLLISIMNTFKNKLTLGTMYLSNEVSFQVIAFSFSSFQSFKFDIDYEKLESFKIWLFERIM